MAVGGRVHRPAICLHGHGTRVAGMARNSSYGPRMAAISSRTQSRGGERGVKWAWPFSQRLRLREMRDGSSNKGPTSAIGRSTRRQASAAASRAGPEQGRDRSDSQVVRCKMVASVSQDKRPNRSSCNVNEACCGPPQTSLDIQWSPDTQ